MIYDVNFSVNINSLNNSSESCLNKCVMTVIALLLGVIEWVLGRVRKILKASEYKHDTFPFLFQSRKY